MQKKYDGIVLFSGGLDSILTQKLLLNQGLRVLGVHFTSPFFGSRENVAKWASCYDLELEALDIGTQFMDLLKSVPPHGIGKTLNPCIDCKILMLQCATRYLERIGGGFIATGEVLGQRPMSQRREALDIIKKRSGASDYLIRPLCAKHLAPAPVEIAGNIDRSRLLAISGRSRNEQLRLAEEYGIDPIPGPGGGCLLTERENARRYWPLVKASWEKRQHCPELEPADFEIIKQGRVLFNTGNDGPCWLCIGRNKQDNVRIASLRQPDDILFRLPFPGPVGLARHGCHWAEAEIREAAGVFCRFTPKAKIAGRSPGEKIKVAAGERDLLVEANMAENWQLPSWEKVHEEITFCRRSWSGIIDRGKE